MIVSEQTDKPLLGQVFEEMVLLTCGTCGTQGPKVYLTGRLPEESAWYCSKRCDWKHASSLSTILEWSEFYLIPNAPPDKKKRQIGEGSSKK